MLDIRRGDIFYVDKFGGQVGSEQRSGRPAVIVSNEAINKFSSTVEIVYCTTAPKETLPTHVKILSAKYESTVLCEQITTISKEKLGKFVGSCNEEEMAEIDRACAISIGLPVGNEPCVKEEKDEGLPERGAYTADQNVNITEFLLRIEVERDTYKQLYEKIVDMMIRRGMSPLNDDFAKKDGKKITR